MKKYKFDRHAAVFFTLIGSSVMVATRIVLWYNEWICVSRAGNGSLQLTTPKQNYCIDFLEQLNETNQIILSDAYKKCRDCQNEKDQPYSWIHSSSLIATWFFATFAFLLSILCFGDKSRQSRCTTIRDKCRPRRCSGSDGGVNPFNCLSCSGVSDDDDLGAVISEGGDDLIPSSKQKFKKGVDGTLKRTDVHALHETMKSVGILFYKNKGHGTVVRIGSKFIMTAWHVVEDIVFTSQQTLEERHIPDPKLLAQTSVYVNFHEFSRQSPASMIFHLNPELIFSDPVLDIVVLSINVASTNDLPPPIRQFADAHSLRTQRNKVSCVHVIGQHPEEDIVVLDAGCKIITSTDEKVKMANQWIEKNRVILKEARVKNNLDPNTIDSAYFDVKDTERKLVIDTFLDFGSSGAAVVAIVPEGVALVGIETHGLPPFFWDTEIKDPYPKSLRMEVACTMKAIKKSTGWERSQAVKDDIFGFQDTEEGAEAMEICEIET